MDRTGRVAVGIIVAGGRKRGRACAGYRRSLNGSWKRVQKHLRSVVLWKKKKQAKDSLRKISDPCESIVNSETSVQSTACMNTVCSCDPAFFDNVGLVLI